VATVELVSTSEIDSSSKTAVDQQQEEEQQQQQQRNSDRQEKPIIVGDKPATNALLRRLETVWFWFLLADACL
jgi:DNA-binding NtrC family response regulator